MNLRFGSSGIRGKYPETVNPAVAFELGKLLPKTLGGTVALGRDPRHSGQVLKAAFVASALQSGARVLDYDMVPTPAIAYETKFHRASAGVVITASHNPPEYNGFKIFDSTGEALKDERSLFKAKVHGAIVASLKDPSFSSKFTDQGLEIVGNTPEEFSRFQAAEFARWKRVIEVGKITAN